MTERHISNQYFPLYCRLKETGELYNYKIYRRSFYDSNVRPYQPNGKRYRVLSVVQIMQMLRAYKQLKDWHFDKQLEVHREHANYFVVLRALYTEEMFSSIQDITGYSIKDYMNMNHLNCHSWLKAEEQKLSSQEKCECVYANMLTVAHQIVDNIKKQISSLHVTCVYDGTCDDMCVSEDGDPIMTALLRIAVAFRLYGTFLFIHSESNGLHDESNKLMDPPDTRICWGILKNAVHHTEQDIYNALLAYADEYQQCLFDRRKKFRECTNFFD